MLVRSSIIAGVLWASAAAAQPALPGAAPGSRPYDLNIYPALAQSGGGLYDLNVAPSQNGPPGTVTLTDPTPAKSYLDDVLRGTHGFVSAGVATHNGHVFDGGVRIPIVPGKADLELAASTGQFGMPGLGTKNATVTTDSYSAGLHIHPTDDVDAFIGVSGVRLHTPAQSIYGLGAYGPASFPAP